MKPKLKNRFLFLTTSAHTNPAAGGRTRIVSEHRYALLDSYEVVILCLVPPRQWVRPLKCFRARHALQRDARCRVYYWPALPVFHCSWLKPATTVIHALVVSLFGIALRIRGIHGHGQGATAVGVLARRMGLHCWVVFDAHGVGPEEYAFSTSDPDRRMIAQLESEEKAVLQLADEVICVSRAMQEHYREKYEIKCEQWSVVPCATNEAASWNVQDRARLRQQLKVEGRFVFVYAGSYRKYQMADEMVTLFEAIKQDLSEAYFLILTGDRDRFARVASARGLAVDDYSIFSLSHEQVLQTLPVADVGFLLRADSPVNRVASPTKFAEYCICGVPVLLTPYVGDYSRVVDNEMIGCCLEGLHVSPKLVTFLKDVHEHREAFAVRCHNYAKQHLSWASAGAVVRRIYERLNAVPSGPGRSKKLVHQKVSFVAD